MADATTEVEKHFADFSRIHGPLDRYIFLRDLHDQQPDQYHDLLLQHTSELLPFIYTPVVGDACLHYHELPLTAHGLYLRATDAGGGVLRKLVAWPNQNIQVVVVTDGERILALGDLGANGMGISEGKATLYTAAAGVDPACVLPVCIDVGTQREALRQHAQYKGVREARLRGPAYEALLDEFVTALGQWRPHVVLQFEDFGSANAFGLLERHRRQMCCFNDDIQGTAATCLAVALATMRGTGRRLQDQRVLFMGAGEAGTGIGNLMALCMLRQSEQEACSQVTSQAAGLAEAGSSSSSSTGAGGAISNLQAARQRCFFMDSQGLVCASRTDLAEHKLPFAHDVPFQPNLLAAIRALRPSILVGVSTIAGAFDEEVIRLMCSMNDRPLVLPLSNPTANAEITFEQAHRWGKGQVMFASGSPFPSLTTSSGQVLVPAQANNAYVFPGIGHAAVLTRSSAITDDIFLVAAQTLGAMSSNADIGQGRLFPPFDQIRAVSARIMAAVCEHIVDSGLGVRPQGVLDGGWEAYTAACMWGGPPAQLLPPAVVDAVHLPGGRL